MKLSDVEVILEWTSAQERLKELQKDFERYSDVMSEAEKQRYPQMIKIAGYEFDKWTTEVAKRDLRQSYKLAVQCWRKYGFNKRLYWKMNNRKWRWDSDVIAKTDGMLFTHISGVFSVCAHSYQLQKTDDKQ